MKTFIYIKESHTLREKTTLEEPSLLKSSRNHFQYELAVYKKQIILLKFYPCAPGTVWEEGKEYTEQEFKVEDMNGHNPFLPSEWVSTPVELKQEERKYPIGGYAPGNYHCTCCICGQKFIGDKRAVECLECATKPPKLFTLSEALEIWEAAIGDVNGTRKKQFFKTKFNISVD